MNPDWRGRLAVLMIDTSPETLTYFKEKISKLFDKIGYLRLHIRDMVVGAPEFFHEEDALEQEYFDIVICDVSLNPDHPDKLGFGVLAEVKRQHPGIYTIAYSRGEVDYLDCLQTGRVDLFISKIRIESED